MIEILIWFFAFFGCLSWFGFWSAQSGRSMASVDPELDNWQDKKSWYSELPEIIIALSFACVSLAGLNKIFDLNIYWSILIFVCASGISYAGKQSATWAYLKWEGFTKDRNNDGVINNDDARDSTLTAWNNWLASKLGYKLGDEGYSWVWAFTKGFITTLPVGAFGAIFQPLGRELASHAKGRLPFEGNFWMESVGDGIGYSSSVIAFIYICKTIGGF